MTTRFKRKRVTNIRLTKSKSYDFKSKIMHLWYRRGLRTKPRNREAQCLSCVILRGSSPSPCVRHGSTVLAACPALTSPSRKWSRWITSAEMCWEETLLFPFTHSGWAGPWNYECHQLKSMTSQNLSWKCCLHPVLPPLPHLGVEELCQSRHARDLLEWIRQTFSLERCPRLSVPLFSMFMPSQMCA